MTPTVKPTEWRTLEKAFKAKRTQGVSNATREENIDQGTQPKPEGTTTPPGTPAEWTAIDAEWKAIDAE